MPETIMIDIYPILAILKFIGMFICAFGAMFFEAAIFAHFKELTEGYWMAILELIFDIFFFLVFLVLTVYLAPTPSL